MKCHIDEDYICFSWDFGCFNSNLDYLSLIFPPTLLDCIAFAGKYRDGFVGEDHSS
jgi:hypothetical protein